MSYTVSLSQGTVTRDSDQKVVAPVEDANDPDYREYVDWCAQGNTPQTVE